MSTFPPRFRSYNDPSCPVHDPETCEFRCAAPDCAEGSHDPLPKCEACSRMYCADHMVACEGLLNCAECFKCVECRKDATAICTECGEFICPDCMVSYDRGEDRETGVRDAGTSCKSCLKGTPQPTSQMYAEPAECPY